MSNPISNIFRGDTFTGTVNLRQTDPIDPNKVNPFPIPSSHLIEIHFPAENSIDPVILSTVNSGEITVVDSDLSTLTYAGAPAKSELMALGTKQAIDIIVTDLTPTPNVVTTFQVDKVLNVYDRANS